MGFRPQGMPSAFARQTPSAGQKRKFQSDLLVTIESFEPSRAQVHAKAEDGRQIIAHISHEAITRNEARKATRADLPTAPKWEGYKIDERMAKSLAVGHKIVLERASVQRKINQNGQDVHLVEAERVINVTDSSPQKTFEGLFTLSTYEGRIFQIQRWEEKAYKIEDEAAIERVRQELDAGADAYLNKQFRPTLGVQFRVVNPSSDPTVPYEVIDTSPPFDWVARTRSETGQEVSPGHPLNGDKFMELIKGYTEYANEKFTADAFPSVFIEFIVYVNYRASQMSRYMAIPEQTWDPLYQLAHTHTKLAQDDEDFVQGKNYAVKGVLQLSSDEADPKTKTFKPRNIALRLHASGPRGHVHAWVRANDGRKTVPHPALRQIPTSKNGPGEKQSVLAAPSQAALPPAAASAPAPAQNPAALKAPAGSGISFEDWPEDDIPFGDGAEDPFVKAVAAGSTAPSASAARNKIANAKKRMEEGGSDS